jgi:hypothetical protein
VITLNPFEVKADSDRGFVAASSLAGGRLAGELKEEMKRSAPDQRNAPSPPV